MTFRSIIVAVILLMCGVPQAVSAAQTIRFASGSVMLSGTFYPGTGAGRRATILLLAGSGNEPRDTVPFHTLERIFNGAGYNVFAYDKRGVGQSGGVYDENASLEQLGIDALAAIRMLKMRSEVDPARMGVWGISQGGSLGPLLATKSRDVRFVISVSGPGVSVAEQAIYFRANQMLDHGATLNDAMQMQALRRVLWAYYGTGMGAQAAQAALDIAKDKPWFKALELPSKLSAPDTLDTHLRNFMRDAAHYDALAVAASIRVPVLYIFGAKDAVVPSDVSLENLIQASARGNGKATFLLFPNAGHGLQVVSAERECHECSEKEMIQTGTWNVVPGFFDAMLVWLKQTLPPHI